MWDWPVTDIFWASPECTNWSVAKGKRRNFDTAMQGSLLDLLIEQHDDERVRLLVRDGHSNSQIAIRLGCSKRAVERSRNRTKQKEAAA